MKKFTPSTWKILASTALLLSVITGAWLIPLPSDPAPEPLAARPSADLPEQKLSREQHMLEPLPAISPEMATAIRQLSNHSTDDLKETENHDGSITLNHEDRLQSVMAGVVGPDGNIIIRHGEDFLQNVKNK